MKELDLLIHPDLSGGGVCLFFEVGMSFFVNTTDRLNFSDKSSILLQDKVFVLTDI